MENYISWKEAFRVSRRTNQGSALKEGGWNGTLPMNGDIRLRRKDCTSRILENAAQIVE